MDNKPKARLENWYLNGSQYSGYSDEDDKRGFLHGDVYGHIRLKDGASIYTSYIVKRDWLNGIIETRNTLYVLGKPDAQWILWLKKNHPERLTEFCLAENSKNG